MGGTPKLYGRSRADRLSEGAERGEGARERLHWRWRERGSEVALPPVRIEFPLSLPFHFTCRHRARRRKRSHRGRHHHSRCAKNSTHSCVNGMHSQREGGGNNLEKTTQICATGKPSWWRAKTEKGGRGDGRGGNAKENKVIGRGDEG